MNEESKFKQELDSFIDKMRDLKNYRTMYGIGDDSKIREKYDALYDVSIEYLQNYLWKYNNIKNIEAELKNEPLSWDDLHKFIDKPVFVKRAGGSSHWIIVNVLKYGREGSSVISEKNYEYSFDYCEFYRREII